MITISPTSSDVELAAWTEVRDEVTRSGRVVRTVVNHRDDLALQFDAAAIDMAHPEHREVSEELTELGFITGTCSPRRPREMALVWRTADHAVRRLHDRLLHLLFRRSALAVQVLLAALGLVAVIAVLRQPGPNLHVTPGRVPLVLALGLAAMVCHEMGHALVTVHFGRRIRLAGMSLHLGAPVFFVDSADAMLLDRRQRLAQVIAGPWADWLATAVAACVGLTLHGGTLDEILHRFVVVNTIVIASNLIPFASLDGALILADLVREPDLNTRIRSRSPLRGWMAWYRIANRVVSTGLLAMSLYFWWQLFGGLISALAQWILGLF